ncbi:hypothetical protein C6361_31005 [Plantactinospora sp. BC1]|uniref:DUF7919 family protein n=1 Tax=Plantactinospora sp. BC1 TaxID=2108470 RepID=UPI000D155A35|nr:hypothetical protein [Plantactinospora sp. BC1]AVT33142.1 hypothetical protein C6361_31005 [Plantactinospora sp. BC1]
MAYFEDLSAYRYSDVDIIEMDWGWLEFRPGYERINVGWLDASHKFDEGPTPNWFVNTLLDIIEAPRINTMRGFHRCPFCPDRSEGSMLSVDHPNGGLLLGHTEIRVPSGPGVMFAAPSLIWHYVTAHSYRPPTEFIEAVQQYDPGWISEASPWIPDDATRITFD